KPATAGEDPRTTAAGIWHHAYDECLELLEEFRQAFATIERTDKTLAEEQSLGAAVRRWLA
ncbi:MAG: hypothetical protein GWN71_41850, partial [Gammaproteobacteria bacterium]|nr:hypothetical protein [Gemmatimonadota bacterium]NIU79854.1 hypothetical protein [Gammaproteobacteria bacterium]